VYFSSKTPQGEVRAKGRQLTCSTCANQVTTTIKWFIDGPWMGFMGVPLVGKKRYFHQCPICSELLEELTKAQVEAVKGN